jgi:2-oxoglutarate ferredoxin oxidoreductase subunit gamma
VELGNVKVANMVALGAYLAKKKTVSLKNILKVMKMMAPSGRGDILEINQKALNKGAGLKDG